MILLLSGLFATGYSGFKSVFPAGETDFILNKKTLKKYAETKKVLLGNRPSPISTFTYCKYKF